MSAVKHTRKHAGDAEEGTPPRGRSPRGPSLGAGRNVGQPGKSGVSAPTAEVGGASAAGPARPLPSLIGHSATRDLLQRLIARKRFPAAVLLIGPPGVGKRTLACSTAALLLDVPTEAAVAAHPDVLRLVPMEDAAMRDRVAGLLSHVHARPMRANVRAIIIEDVDRLSPAAAALLLKAIEDAPAYAKFLLTASILDRVASTVRSRALVRTLAPVSEEVLSQALRVRGISGPEELARLSGGRPGLALRLAADEELLSRYRLWDTALRSGTWGANLLSSEDGDAVSEFFAFLESTLRHGTPKAALVRRAREAEAMIRQHVPPHFVIEYVVRSTP